MARKPMNEREIARMMNDSDNDFSEDESSDEIDDSDADPDYIPNTDNQISKVNKDVDPVSDTDSDDFYGPSSSKKIRLPVHSVITDNKEPGPSGLEPSREAVLIPQRPPALDRPMEANVIPQGRPQALDSQWKPMLYHKSHQLWILQ